MRKNVQSELEKLKKIMDASIEKDNMELAMQAVSAYASYLYKEGTQHTSSFLEDSIKKIGKSKTIPEPVQEYGRDEKTVLFYDGFGYDTRGLALIYLKALGELGYRVIYITDSRAEGGQEELHDILSPYHIVWEYFNENKGYMEKVRCLIEKFDHYVPAYSFLYTWPEDVSAVLAFMKVKYSKRLFINLTDHAFWLGLSAFDCCIEFRNYGYEMSIRYRKIDETRLAKLPYYPFINKEKEFEGFPMDVTEKRVVFSGGSLYKTVSEDNLYYLTVQHILANYPDTVFIYAGYGDASRLKGISAEFPGRVIHLRERKDLFQVMKHSYVFLNTYPISGGLMAQYAAAAGTIPLTLDVGNESEGLFLNQSEMGVFYEDFQEFLADIDRIFTDQNYYLEKQNKIRHGLITEIEFKEELENILKLNKSKFEFSRVDFELYQPQITESKRRKYLDDAIGKVKNRKLFPYFKAVFFQKVCCAAVKRIKK